MRLGSKSKSLVSRYKQIALDHARTVLLLNYKPGMSSFFFYCRFCLFKL